MQALINSRTFIWLEFTVLMLGLPVLFSSAIPLRLILPALWLTALYCVLVLRLEKNADDGPLWQWGALEPSRLAPVMARFAIASAGIVALTLYLVPDSFLGFVRTQPLFWALVMVAYPLLSAIPQELIYRGHFFRRYGILFTSPAAMILASGALFAAAHLIFQNWIAPALCLVGGVMFARTYYETRSLALVSLEHALYGCMLFTVGLGRYFYHGAVGAP